MNLLNLTSMSLALVLIVWALFKLSTGTFPYGDFEVPITYIQLMLGMLIITVYSRR